MNELNKLIKRYKELVDGKVGMFEDKYATSPEIGFAELNNLYKELDEIKNKAMAIASDYFSSITNPKNNNVIDNNIAENEVAENIDDVESVDNDSELINALDLSSNDDESTNDSNEDIESLTEEKENSVKTNNIEFDISEVAAFANMVDALTDNIYDSLTSIRVESARKHELYKEKLKMGIVYKTSIMDYRERLKKINKTMNSLIQLNDNSAISFYEEDKINCEKHIEDLNNRINEITNELNILKNGGILPEVNIDDKEEKELEDELSNSDNNDEPEDTTDKGLPPFIPVLGDYDDAIAPVNLNDDAIAPVNLNDDVIAPVNLNDDVIAPVNLNDDVTFPEYEGEDVPILARVSNPKKGLSEKIKERIAAAICVLLLLGTGIIVKNRYDYNNQFVIEQSQNIGLNNRNNADDNKNDDEKNDDEKNDDKKDDYNVDPTPSNPTPTDPTPTDPPSTDPTPTDPPSTDPTPTDPTPTDPTLVVSSGVPTELAPGETIFNQETNVEVTNDGSANEINEDGSITPQEDRNLSYNGENAIITEQDTQPDITNDVPTTNYSDLNAGEQENISNKLDEFDWYTSLDDAYGSGPVLKP